MQEKIKILFLLIIITVIFFNNLYIIVNFTFLYEHMQLLLLLLLILIVYALYFFVGGVVVRPLIIQSQQEVIQMEYQTEMGRKYNNITELIGNTPLVRINKFTGKNDAIIWAKVEYFNPGGSIKDRIGLAMILDAEEKGLLKPGDTFIEPTSGNTGIALALVAAQRGYKAIFTMPETMSKERRDLLSALGAELVLVSPEEGPGVTGSIKKAEKLAKEHGYFMPNQFENPANPAIHEKTTGPELAAAFNDKGLDYFVAGIGTGGTITGAGKVLREYFPEIKIYGVEPKSSAVLSGNPAGNHNIQGIGAGFVPKVLDTSIYDKIIQVADEDAITMTRQLAQREGLLVGISSGAAMYAALQVAKDMGNNKHLAVIFPDTGERYLSMDIFGGGKNGN